MESKVRPLTGVMTLFTLGEIFVFGFICLLQFVSVKANFAGFIMTLIAMHCGIVMFILSKRLFKVGKEFKKHYIAEYIMLACYLPFLFVKLAGVEIDRGIKLPLIFTLTGIVIILSIINNIYLAKRLKTMEEQNGQNINEEYQDS